MGSPYLFINEARNLLLEKAAPIREIETKKLLEANNCVLAESVFSSIDVPLVTNSAMDGYAVRAEDVGEVRARLQRRLGGIVGRARVLVAAS